ncbi:MAG: DUF4038 domain-containing protein [Gemmatimonadales bacterium]|nr:DUF4038 domain-containing protein [Gemmatimonadales bacterium]NIN09992.1 DUF4038 domain-containing protein [Gemmatimonadales bacterium]NIR01338.1 DUF4038 domain-containing protein [Gemmatimonadales bacterium]NIS65250.1 DUF4038 domain-containing protein [Gemmatimonadales bacterium]
MRTTSIWCHAWTLVGLVLSSVACSGDTDGSAISLPGLKVSENRRFLVTDTGDPFFWLGDTAWELFHRLDREEADRYLEDRASKGFTVIQAVALAELDGLNTPNPYGHLPLEDNDPARPAVTAGPDNDYWDHVDYIVEKANSLGLYIGFLPTWGDKWNQKWGVGPVVFTPENAEAYGEWLGRRYRDNALIWILGGDRPIETDEHRAIMVAMARGLSIGDGGAHLRTYHPMGGHSSSEWFHGDDWLDFNMRQNGHEAEFTRSYATTVDDYDREPPKPVIDGEPIYEDHPVSFRPAERGHSITADVRRPLYWDLFSGAFGHTYGHHSIWQMWRPGREPINSPLMPWYEAIAQPGSGQMQFGRRLIESRPFLTRIPDDSILAPGPVATNPLGAGRYRFKATRDSEGTYAMVYAPVGRAFTVRMEVIRGPLIRAWWYDPRTGEAQEIGTFANTGERTFIPPDPGEMLDWVLVLDDRSSDYPAPGQPIRRTGR